MNSTRVLLGWNYTLNLLLQKKKTLIDFSSKYIIINGKTSRNIWNDTTFTECEIIIINSSVESGSPDLYETQPTLSLGIIQNKFMKLSAINPEAYC